MTTQLNSITAANKVFPEVYNRPGGKRLILLAEHDDANYFYFEVVTLKMNIRLIRASDGIQAVEAFKSNPGISLILINLWLPKMNGCETTAQIRRINPKIPVIALSSVNFPDYQQMAIDTGCDDYITKPIKPGDFRDILRKWITITE